MNRRPLCSSHPRKSRRRTSVAGFTILEVILAMVILGVGILGLMQAFPAGLRQSNRIAERTKVALLARGILDGLRTDADGFPIIPGSGINYGAMLQLKDFVEDANIRELSFPPLLPGVIPAQQNVQGQGIPASVPTVRINAGIDRVFNSAGLPQPVFDNKDVFLTQRLVGLPPNSSLKELPQPDPRLGVQVPFPNDLFYWSLVVDKPGVFDRGVNTTAFQRVLSPVDRAGMVTEYRKLQESQRLVRVTVRIRWAGLRSEINQHTVSTIMRVSPREEGSVRPQT